MTTEERRRRVVELYEHGGKPFAEIGPLLGVSGSTATRDYLDALDVRGESKDCGGRRCGVCVACRAIAYRKHKGLPL